MNAQLSPETVEQLRRSKSQLLLHRLARCEEVAIVTHDNPDPDGIATGWAVYALVHRLLALPIRFVAGGRITRAENRQMVKLLGPPIELVDQFQPGPKCGVILVDCGPQSSNHLLYDKSIDPLAVIDHHDGISGLDRVALSDVRCDVVAAASIATAYLHEQCLEPGPKLATGLLYAIRSELPGETGNFSHLDHFASAWLSQRADQRLLADIEAAPLPQSYYRDLVLALQSAFRSHDTGVCLLPRAETAEIVGEVADLLIRCEGIDRVLCGTAIEDDLFVSVRTKGDFDAAQLVRETLRGLGHGGGHPHRAGGRIHLAKATRVEELEGRLLQRWWEVCGVSPDAATRLISSREIIEHL
jgi:nanoRNase/pAp phosphatase (c-di-AMP/oligoRNAs hydrolase)